MSKVLLHPFTELDLISAVYASLGAKLRDDEIPVAEDIVSALASQFASVPREHLSDAVERIMATPEYLEGVATCEKRRMGRI